MPVTAKLRYLRIAPRKVRLVADLIRGKPVEEVQTILNFTQKRAALPILKLLKQAIANAKNNFQMKEKNLYISKILVDEGPKLKRVMPRARGHADEIQKKTSHITIILDELPKSIPLRRGIEETLRLPRVGKQPRMGVRNRGFLKTTTLPPPSRPLRGPRRAPREPEAKPKAERHHTKFGVGERAND